MAVSFVGEHPHVFPPGLDPVQQRRLRPRVGRLSGLVLLAAVLFLVVRFAPLIGLPL